MLLENHNGTLPLGLDQIGGLVVGGSGADNSGRQYGGWTYTWEGVDYKVGSGATVWDEAKQRLNEDLPAVLVSSDGNPMAWWPTADEEGSSNLPGPAGSDSQGRWCVLVVAEPPYVEGFGD